MTARDREGSSRRTPATNQLFVKCPIEISTDLLCPISLKAKSDFHSNRLQPRAILNYPECIAALGQAVETLSAFDSSLLVDLPSRIQIIEIQNRVEDQEVTARSLPSPERIV